MTPTDYLASYPDSWSQYHITSWSSLFSTNIEELRIDIAEIMAAQKQIMPSFASIITVLSIAFYCAGFLRVELELHEQKKRITALESVAEAKFPSNNAYMKIIKNAPGKYVLPNLEYKRCVAFMKSVQSSEFFLPPPPLPRKKANNRWTCSCLFCLWCEDAKKAEGYQVNIL